MVPTLELGGLQQAIVNIARFAKSDTVEVHVASLREVPNQSTAIVDRLLAENAVVHHLGVPGRADRSVVDLTRAVRRLRRLISQYGFHVVDSAPFEADIASRLACLGVGVPQVSHLINTTFGDMDRLRSRARASWRPTAARFVEKLTGRLTVRFVAITEAVAEAAIAGLRLAPSRVIVIRRGVDTEIFPALDPRSNGGDGTTRFLSIGRLQHQKQHSVLIDAMGILIAQGVRASLTIVGEGPLRGELDEQVDRLELNSAITIQEPSATILELHQSHDIFVFPSAFEGLGNALLEAMSSARPCIASDIPVLREVLGSAGFFSQVGSADSLAQQMSELARRTPTELKQLGDACRSQVLAVYDARKNVQELLEFYRSI